MVPVRPGPVGGSFSTSRAIYDTFESFHVSLAPFVEPTGLYCLERLGIISGSFWGSFLGPFLGHFCPFWARSFCGFLMIFWGVECKIKQNDAKEGKTKQKSANLQQGEALLTVFRPFLGLFGTQHVLPLSVLSGRGRLR